MRGSPASGSTVLQPASLNNAGGLSIKALLSRLLPLETRGTPLLQCPPTPRRGASFTAFSRPPQGLPKAAVLSSPRPSRPGARSDLWGSSCPGWRRGEAGEPPVNTRPAGPRHRRDPWKASGCGVPAGDRGPRPVPGESLPARPDSRAPPPEKRRPLTREGAAAAPTPCSAHPWPDAARRRSTPQ